MKRNMQKVVAAVTTRIIDAHNDDIRRITKWARTWRLMNLLFFIAEASG